MPRPLAAGWPSRRAPTGAAAALTLAGAVAITVAGPSAARAAPGAGAGIDSDVDGEAAPVVGGSDVPRGKWRDVAAVLFGGLQGCTGVLIAPDLVMTAAHCIDDTLDQVLIGTNSLAAPSRGELIDVARRIVMPDPFDAAVLVLDRPSTVPPRRLATGWVRGDIVDGARVELVGYGAIDRDAVAFVDELQEAWTVITDAGCTRSAGCDPAALPAGELGAGGMGVDTCPGDSGGPLYLMTSSGAFLAGITSRGYGTNRYYCTEGGIYVRADKAEIVAYIEQETGVFLPDGLGPHADPVRMLPGTSVVVDVDPGDPLAGRTYTWAVLSGPAHGGATIDEAGRLTIDADLDYLGDDGVVVQVTDVDDPGRSARGRVAVEVVDDLDGGCCGAGGGGGGGGPGSALVVGLALARRRRRRMRA